MPREVTLQDVRLYPDGGVMAGPLWAYRRAEGGRLEPDPAAWRKVLRRLQRRADNRHRRKVAEYEVRRAEWGAKSAEERSRYGAYRGPREPERVKVRPPSYWDRYPWLMPTCRVCRAASASRARSRQAPVRRGTAAARASL
jgi:hypothetical protein